MSLIGTKDLAQELGLRNPLKTWPLRSSYYSACPGHLRGRMEQLLHAINDSIAVLCLFLRKDFHHFLVYHGKKTLCYLYFVYVMEMEKREE